MNRLYKYLGVFVFFFAEINSEAFALNINADTTSQCKLILANDSGFVTLKDGFDFLLYNSLIDTIPISNAWDLYNQTDTIGKYYRMGNNNHYIMCLLAPASNEFAFEHYIIMEIDAEGKLLKSERFFHSHYRYCWNNDYDGFFKYGNFFGFKQCSTGTGFAHTFLYLFKEVTSQYSMTPILINYYYCYIEYFTLSTISMKIKKDELIVHHVKETGKEQEEEIDDNYFKVLHVDKFKIKYFYENGQWNTKDKNKDKFKEFHF